MNSVFCSFRFSAVFEVSAAFKLSDDSGFQLFLGSAGFSSLDDPGFQLFSGFQLLSGCKINIGFQLFF